MLLVAHDEAAQVAQPSEEALNLPSAFVASQWAAILGFRLLPVPTVGSNHLASQLGQFLIQRIRIVRAVAYQPSREISEEARIERGRDQGDLVRRSRGGADGERKTK